MVMEHRGNDRISGEAAAAIAKLRQMGRPGDRCTLQNAGTLVKTGRSGTMR